MKFRSMLALCALSAAMFTVGVAEPAAAVGCTGTGCDNQGPKGNGCFADDQRVASGDSGTIQLRYSRACHAFWAYGPNAPQMWDVELHLEMQWKNNNGNWVWADPPRLITNFEALGPADWTNALGARTQRFRFRALYVDQPGATLHATPWALGGTR